MVCTARCLGRTRPANLQADERPDRSGGATALVSGASLRFAVGILCEALTEVD